jgi:hypothetical protein
MQEYKAAVEEYSKGIQEFEEEQDGVGAGADEEYILRDIALSLYSNRSLV